MSSSDENRKPDMEIFHVRLCFYFTGKGGGSLYIVDATLPLWAV